MNSSVLTLHQGPFFAFAAVITGVAAWSIWGQDLFPSRDPTGGMQRPIWYIRIQLTVFNVDPDTWTHDQCVTWLNNVSTDRKLSSSRSPKLTVM